MLAALSVVIPFCSHYLLCAALLFLCYKCKENGIFSLCALTSVLMALVAAVGSWLLYAGPFVDSGKTFAMFVTYYAPYTLPVFLFPVAGLVLTLRCRKQ